MLSVRNMLIENTPKPTHTHRPAKLDISSLLNHNSLDNNSPPTPSSPTTPSSSSLTYFGGVQDYAMLEKQTYYTQPSYLRRLTPPPTLSSSSSSSQPYSLMDKRQRRSSRQHQIESRKIEQELLQDRRNSCTSSSSSSSLYSYTHDELPIKAKRRRASTKQLDVLNKVFERTFFPSTQLRAELGRQLGMSPRTVQIWFQNRRQAIRTRERSSANSSRENSTSPE